jgi:hypothetical protein
LGYPNAEEEDEILQRYQRSDPLIDLHAVATAEDIDRAIKTGFAFRLSILGLLEFLVSNNNIS